MAGGNEEIARRVERDDMASFSSLSYGAAGACLAMVLLLAQVWGSEPKLLNVWALVLAGVAMPIFFAVGLFDQVWTTTKLTYLDLFRIPRINYLRATLWYSASANLLGSIGCVMYSLSPVAGLLFGACTVVMGFGVYFAFRYAAPIALLRGMEVGKNSPPPPKN